MDKSRAPYFTQKEQTLILNKYEEFKSIIEAFHQSVTQIINIAHSNAKGRKEHYP